MKIKIFLYQNPFLAYLLLACIVFWPISLGIYVLQYDAIDVYLPWRFFGSESIRQGIVPLWNPYQSGGYPFFADLQYAIWNPELFIVSLFGRYNAYTAQFLYVLYIVIGGLGFNFLLHQFNIEKKSAFFGGILFIFSGMLIGHAQSIASVVGAVWLPWAIGSYLAVLKNNFTLKTNISFIFFTFLMLSGGYQAVSIMLFYLLLFFAIYRLAELIKQKDYSLIKRFVIGHLLIITVLSTLMMGIIISLIDVFPYLSRLGGVTIEATQRFIMHPKAIISSIFPLAATKMKLPHMDISFQNIFNGTLIFFLLFYGFKNYKKISSPYLYILGIFGVIYGFASTGYFTPVQPFLATYIPGFNLFFYPIFYRYFTWITLLIIASYGLQYFSESKKSKPFLYFLLLLIIIFSGGILSTSSELQTLSNISFSNRVEVLRTLSFKSSILLQSIIHLFLVSTFTTLYFIVKQKSILIYLFLIVELALISQLNMPITVHGTAKSAEINTYLNSKGEGFLTPDNTKTLGDIENEGKEGVIWRNQGNFTNIPNLTGFTSFKLNSRDNVIDNYPEIESSIKMKPFVFLKRNKDPVDILSFSPNNFTFNVNSPTKDTLIVQQANYPGWTAFVNQSETEILTVNGFEMQVALNKGENTISFKFKKPLVSFLFYFTHIGFIILLLAFFCYNTSINNINLKYGIVIFVLLFMAIKLLYFNFSEPKSNKYILQIGEQNELVIPATLNQELKGKILSKVLLRNSNRLELQNKGIDFSPEIIALLNYKYSVNKDISLKDDKILFKLNPIQNINLEEISTIDTVNRFSDAVQSENLKNINSENTNLLTFGLRIHSDTVPGNLFFVVDIQREGQSIFYKATPIKKYTLNNKSSYFVYGFILPSFQKEDKVAAYLWNNSSDPFSFSNFTSDVIIVK